jgi:hypothetical protein
MRKAFRAKRKRNFDRLIVLKIQIKKSIVSETMDFLLI